MKNYREYTVRLIKKIKKRPFLETLKIIIFYIMIGGSWILLSDRIISVLIKNKDLYIKVQLYKGWLYVLITAFVFFLIIFKRMQMYQKTLDEIHMAYDEISASSEEVIALDEELSKQNEELNKQRDSLLESEQRYVLALEVASDGVWDWDLKDDSYFSSIMQKNKFGYQTSNSTGKFQDWKERIHPDDHYMAVENIKNYLRKSEGVLEQAYRLRSVNGEYRWLLSIGKAILDGEGNAIRMTGTHKDITSEKEMEMQLYHASNYDYLTGLPNRVLFEEEAKKLIRESESSDKKIGFVYLDIDDIKHINDIMGHSEGDKVIKKIGKTLADCLVKPNIIARVGGDEFSIILPNREDVSQIKEDIKNILNQIKENWILEGKSFLISATAGISVYPDHGQDYDTLIKNADTAMFKGKEKRKGKYLLFNQEMHQETLEYVDYTSKLRKAIEKEEFTLYYQPQVDILTNEIIGVEALIRWYHPEIGFISPSEFIPFAEKIEYIDLIEKWVLKTAFEQKKQLDEKGFRDLKLSVNLSSKRLTQPGLVDSIKQILFEKQMDAKGIELEITETAVIDELNKAISTLSELKELGFDIALDDFGTGHSSLTYLQKLPIDILKIDRSFIMNVIDEDDNVYIFKMIVDLAHNLNLKVVAEGVETKEQLGFLKKSFCDFAQGFYFERPIPFFELELLLEKKLIDAK